MGGIEMDAPTQDTPEQIKTQSVLIDQSTKKVITGPYLTLKLNGTDYHFQDWQSVADWAQSLIKPPIKE